MCINTSRSYVTDSYAVVTLTLTVSKGCVEHTRSQAGGGLGCPLSQLCVRQGSSGDFLGLPVHSRWPPSPPVSGGSQSWLASHLRALPSLHMRPPSPLLTLPPSRTRPGSVPLCSLLGTALGGMPGLRRPSAQLEGGWGAHAEVAVMSPGPVSELTLPWEPWSWPLPCLHC